MKKERKKRPQLNETVLPFSSVPNITFIIGMLNYMSGLYRGEKVRICYYCLI